MLRYPLRLQSLRMLNACHHGGDSTHESAQERQPGVGAAALCVRRQLRLAGQFSGAGLKQCAAKRQRHQTQAALQHHACSHDASKSRTSTSDLHTHRTLESNHIEGKNLLAMARCTGTLPSSYRTSTCDRHIHLYAESSCNVGMECKSDICLPPSVPAASELLGCDARTALHKKLPYTLKAGPYCSRTHLL